MSTYTVIDSDAADLTIPVDFAVQVSDNTNYVSHTVNHGGSCTIERMDGETIIIDTEEEEIDDDTTAVTGFTYSITDADGDIYNTHGWPVTTTADLDRAQDTITEFLNNTTC